MPDSITTPETKPEAPRTEESQVKALFAEPKLIFIEPKLTYHGDATRITQITQGFFGTFTP